MSSHEVPSRASWADTKFAKSQQGAFSALWILWNHFSGWWRCMNLAKEFVISAQFPWPFWAQNRVFFLLSFKEIDSAVYIFTNTWKQLKNDHNAVNVAPFLLSLEFGLMENQKALEIKIIVVISFASNLQHNSSSSSPSSPSPSVPPLLSFMHARNWPDLSQPW